MPGLGTGPISAKGSLFDKLGFYLTSFDLKELGVYGNVGSDDPRLKHASQNLGRMHIRLCNVSDIRYLTRRKQF